jgi:hypothetical protein
VLGVSYDSSDEEVLATLTADGAGVVHLSFSATADTPTGNYRVALASVDPADGTRIDAILRVDEAQAAAPSGLALTGPTVVSLVVPAILILGAGAALLSLARRTRRTA